MAEARDRGRGDRDRGRRGGGKLMRILDEICDIDSKDECEDGEKGYYRQAESGSCRFTELPEADELPDECEEVCKVFGLSNLSFYCMKAIFVSVLSALQFALLLEYFPTAPSHYDINCHFDSTITIFKT